MCVLKLKSKKKKLRYYTPGNLQTSALISCFKLFLRKNLAVLRVPRKLQGEIFGKFVILVNQEPNCIDFYVDFFFVRIRENDRQFHYEEFLS